ncbi:hypothetical protein P7K49_027819, partial [Saguinus oedipus]
MTAHCTHGPGWQSTVPPAAGKLDENMPYPRAARKPRHRHGPGTELLPWGRAQHRGLKKLQP